MFEVHFKKSSLIPPIVITGSFCCFMIGCVLNVALVLLYPLTVYPPATFSTITPEYATVFTGVLVFKNIS